MMIDDGDGNDDNYGNDLCIILSPIYGVFKKLKKVKNYNNNNKECLLPTFNNR